MCVAEILCDETTYADDLCYNHYRREWRRAQNDFYAREQAKMDRIWTGIVQQLGIEGANGRKVGI